MARKRHHIQHCWPRLPLSFPTHPMLGMKEKEGQLTFTFHDVYRAQWHTPPSAKEEVRTRMKTQGRLLYCNETDRWQVHVAYDDPISLHCGECFEIEVEKTYLSCRIEWDSEWYVIFSCARFRLHPRTNYRVRGI